MDVVVDTNDDASMDEIYVTYVDDEHVDNHDYDDNTDDDHDSNNDIKVRACNARANTNIYMYIYTSVDPCITCTAIEIIVVIMIISSIIIIIMIIYMLIINIRNINLIHGCIIIGVNNIYVIIIMALPL